MLILEANLPVLPGERVNDLLLGALLSANLQSLIFTDSHTSANENNIAFDWPFWWRQSYEMTYWDRDFSLQSQRHTEQQAAYKDIWSHTVQIFTAREWISSMLLLPLTWLPNPTMFGERTCRIQNCGSAVAALREKLRSKPAHFGISHGYNLGSHDDIKDEDTRAPILLHIQDWLSDGRQNTAWRKQSARRRFKGEEWDNPKDTCNMMITWSSQLIDCENKSHPFQIHWNHLTHESICLGIGISPNVLHILGLGNSLKAPQEDATREMDTCSLWWVNFIHGWILGWMMRKSWIQFLTLMNESSSCSHTEPPFIPNCLILWSGLLFLNFVH